MDMNNIGLKFDNSYLRLPESFYTYIEPEKVSTPEIIITNDKLANELDLDINQCSKKELAQIFSGNILPEGADPIAQAYAGHQFGNFTILGDGRAHLIGEHITANGKRFDLQLKGSGQTPYSRKGDGKAAISPVLREYIISEAMHALSVPTTRSLAAVRTGETVMRDKILPGAILTRIASSHIRIGTFEYIASQNDDQSLRELADYVIERHYPDIKDSEHPYLELINEVMNSQINLIINWLRVGFIHGVMNTDNMTLSGETIDYGPCAFMDEYNPQTSFSYIDYNKRYSYANQPYIVKWNIARFAETLLPMLHNDIKKAADIAEGVIEEFDSKFQNLWIAMMGKKLGLSDAGQEDHQLIGKLLRYMQSNNMDYTNTFRDLSEETLPELEIYQTIEFNNWHDQWRVRLKRSKKTTEESIRLMEESNPVFIPRNHNVNKALEEAEINNDMTLFNNLLEVIKDPYNDNLEYSAYKNPPKTEEKVRHTFCGT